MLCCEPMNIGETCVLLKVELVAFFFVKGESTIFTSLDHNERRGG